MILQDTSYGKVLAIMNIEVGFLSKLVFKEAFRLLSDHPQKVDMRPIRYE
jgi:hypothetical protein